MRKQKRALKKSPLFCRPQNRFNIHLEVNKKMQLVSDVGGMAGLFVQYLGINNSQTSADNIHFCQSML